MKWEAGSTAFNMAIRMSQLRAAVRVGLALAEKFPTEEAWEAEMETPEVQENLQALAEVLSDVQIDLDTAESQEIVQAVENHYERAEEALLPLCERYGISREDMLVVLVG